MAGSTISNSALNQFVGSNPGIQATARRGRGNKGGNSWWYRRTPNAGDVGILSGPPVPGVDYDPRGGAPEGEGYWDEFWRDLKRRAGVPRDGRGPY